MAEVGTYYITIMPDMSKFTGGVNSAIGGLGTNATGTMNRSFMDVLKGSAIGTMLGNVATDLGGMVMSGIDTGIQRADTLRNFPRVMESMGYSADEAQGKIKLIMDRLRGLPASTQDVVRLTQSIADSTGSLDLAARASLGFTDMLIANGASTAEVTQAQGVLNRVLGKGSATTAQWQSLVSVMPAQLGLVAQHMLGTGASTEDLHKALEDGTVSWNDFLQAIVDMDENGIQVAGRDIASFEQQARANADGIGTAIENLSNRIGIGWANIINAIGVEGISGTINEFADTIMNGMTKVGDGISYVKGLVDESDIGDSLSRIGDAIGKMVSNLWTEEDTELVKQFAQWMVDLVDRALKWMADNGDIVCTVLAGIAGGLAGIAAVQAVIDLAGFLGLLEGVPGILSVIWAAIAANPFVILAGVIIGAIVALVYFFTQTEEGKALWDGFCTFMNDTITSLKEDWDEMCSNIQKNWEDLQAFIDGIPAWWDGVKKYWSDALQEQVDNFKKAGDKIKSDFSEAWENLKADAKQKLEDAKSAVSEKLEAIKNLFKFEWSLPAPKLPHIDYHWQDIGGVISIPVFDGISWYAKGGVFDAASIIGIGEAGREAALPLNRQTYGEIAHGIMAEMGETGGVVIEKIADTLIVRNEDDIDYIIGEVSRRTERERMALA